MAMSGAPRPERSRRSPLVLVRRWRLLGEKTQHETRYMAGIRGRRLFGEMRLVVVGQEPIGGQRINRSICNALICGDGPRKSRRASRHGRDVNREGRGFRPIAGAKCADGGSIGGDRAAIMLAVVVHGSRRDWIA